MRDEADRFEIKASYALSAQGRSLRADAAAALESAVAEAQARAAEARGMAVADAEAATAKQLLPVVDAVRAEGERARSQAEEAITHLNAAKGAGCLSPALAKSGYAALADQLENADGRTECSAVAAGLHRLMDVLPAASPAGRAVHATLGRVAQDPPGSARWAWR